MRPFYQDIVIEKSWQTLKALNKKINFILIGGWAVYLYTKALKSKDIDIIVDFNALEKLKTNFELIKNDRLKKYEIKREGIEIDIYLPFFSNLSLPVEELIKYKDNFEGFTVLKKELLLMTKLYAYFQRKLSIKGQKDKIDIISLIFSQDFDFEFYNGILKKFKLDNYQGILEEILKNTKEAKELGYSFHFFAKKKKEVLAKLFVAK